MFLGHDYHDGQRSLKDNQPEGHDGAPRFVDPTQLLYDPTIITKNRGLKVSTDDVDISLAAYNSPTAARDGLSFGQPSELAIDPRLLLGDDARQSLGSTHTPGPGDWRSHHADTHELSSHHVAAGGGISGYNVDTGAGASHGQFDYMSNSALAHQLANFPGPNDVSGTFNPFVYQPPTTTYLNDPFLYATHAQQAEDPYQSHPMLAAPSQSTYQQQLRELNPNHLDNYEERDSAIPKRKRPEKVRTAKPLTMDELEHDNSRFALVVKALISIEDPTKRTVPEIAKTVQDMHPGRYADFETVKRMVNDVLQKHKAFYHNGRGSPYYLNLEEGRARKEFPSTRNARSSRHEFEEENVPPRMGMYGRRQTRYSRRNRAQDLHIMQHGGNENAKMLMQEYMNSPLDDSHAHPDQQYFR